MPGSSFPVEHPGEAATPEHFRVLYNRYHFAQERSEGRDVLEAACGTGLGLGFLAARARRVVGGDINERNLRIAQETYKDKPSVLLARADAQRMPFPDGSFDVVIMFEAVYFLPDAASFVREAHRVLRPDGELLISSAHCEWPGFHPVPNVHRYYTHRQIAELLSQNGFHPAIYAAFPEQTAGAAETAIESLRRLAVRLRVIRSAMRCKTFLKRMIYGRLTTIPREIKPAMAGVEPFFEISKIADPKNYRIIYAIGRKVPIDAAT